MRGRRVGSGGGTHGRRITLVVLCASIVLAGPSCTSQPVWPEDQAPIFGTEVTFVDHREQTVSFGSEGVPLEGTLYLPLVASAELMPSVVYVHGSGEEPRMPWIANPSWSAQVWVDRGIAVLAYDKRGVGESGGDCCPWSDEAYFPLLARDALAGVAAIGLHREVDAQRIGLYGFSQGGWIVPHAAARSDAVAFVLIGSGPAVTLGEESYYSDLTGECSPSGRSTGEIDALMARAPRWGFDPLPDLRSMRQPAVFLQGMMDVFQPVRTTLANLDTILESQGKDWLILTFPEADHSLLRAPGYCGSHFEQVDWVGDAFGFLLSRIFVE